MAWLRTVPHARVLDLGAASPAKLAVYEACARGVRFVDLLREIGEGQAEPTGEALTAMLSDPVGPTDAVLMWDALDYLSPSAASTLVERLARSARPGARLFAVVSSSRTLPATPARYEILDGERLVARPSSAATRPGPQLAPAEVERRLSPFRVERSFVLRHGARELLGVLPPR